MSVDVSPDGATILFDLLGDIYRMPIKGGKAERITSRPAFDYAPTRSPSEPKSSSLLPSPARQAHGQ